MPTDLMLGPDASHHQGDAVDWPSILRNQSVRFVWCKATQGSNFTDPQAARNLAAFKTAADREEVDSFWAYHWPSSSPVAAQVARYLGVISRYADDPRFRWVIDCEGGSVDVLDGIAEHLSTRLGADRGGVYGGSFLIGSLNNPAPHDAPFAASVSTFVRPAYIDDPPGKGRNAIPRLFDGRVDFWQFTNGLWGPNDRDRFPRTLPGGWHGDTSAYWEPTAGRPYRAWLDATTPGREEREMLDPKTDMPAFAQMFATLTGFGGKDAGFWLRCMAGIGDVMRGQSKRELPDPYSDAFDFAVQLGLKGQGEPGEQGAKGDPGEAGAPGEPGPQGEAGGIAPGTKIAGTVDPA